jgi:glycosyltransferase involved in cell wall biosynthesis
LQKKQDTERKVLIIGPAWPLRGGLSTYNQILANEFQKQGFKVTILTFKLQYPNFLFPGKTQYSSDPAPEGLNIEVRINSINPFNWIFTGLKYRNQQPDLVIIRYWLPFMGPCLGTVGRIIKGNGKSRIVAITDNVIPHEKRFGDTFFTKYFLKACHGFVAMSQSVLVDLNKFVRNKPALYNPHPIYNSFKPSISKSEACEILKINSDTNYLLFFGFIRAYKGLDLLLEAFAKIDRQKINLKLIVAGEFYEDEKPYMEIIEKFNLLSDILFYKDFIPDSEVHLYFSAADVTVQPYKDATQSGVTQVAYFYNKPMIVTNIGGLPELVPNNQAGFVIDKNPEEIAKAIEKFYSENWADRMGSFVKNEKEKYSWEKMIASLWKAAEK